MKSGDESSNRFTFVVPMFNASRYVARMLHSVCGQSYDNWRIIIIDDVSSNLERTDQELIINKFKSLPGVGNKIHVTWNEKKRWEVANVLHGISLADSDDIICRLDADDWLCDLDALAILNQAYINDPSLDAAWSAHRWGFSDRNISAPMPDNVDVYRYPWCASHLKTFKKKVIERVPYENFTNEAGELIRRAGDQCVYLPVLHNAKRWSFIPRVFYHYTIDEQGGAVYQTDDAKFQKNEAEFIRHRGYVSAGDSWEDVLKASQ